MITSFTLASGAVGTVITITGQALSGATKVTFNGTAGTITKRECHQDHGDGASGSDQGIDRGDHTCGHRYQQHEVQGHLKPHK